MREKNRTYHYTSINLPDLKIPKSNVTANTIYAVPNLNGKPNSILDGLSKINCIVGPNNSGKSRLLRTLFFNVEYKCTIDDFNFNTLHVAVLKFEADILKIFNGFGSLRPETGNGGLFNIFRPHAKIADLLVQKALLRGNFSFFQETRNDLEAQERSLSDVIPRVMNSYNNIALLKQNLVSCMKMFSQELQNIENSMPSFPLCPQSQIYIPILRTLRSTESEVKLGRTTALDYFQNKEDAHVGNTIGNNREIFDGTDIHKEMVNLLLISSTGRQKILEYEKFLSNEFFDQQSIQLSPNHFDKTIHITIGAKELPAYSLGDGMQTILMVTFPAFFATEPKMIFVEEPEVYLHPGMQRRLLEVILSNENLKRHQWFFTTHSNHLIDMTLDYSQISIFHCEKKSESSFNITRMTSPDLNLLSQLGVMASSVFRTNATIWVEGITDRRYLRVFILKFFEETVDKIGKRMREDIHYSFVELGGGNMVHFDFFGRKNDEMNVQFIAGNSFVIIDGDNKKGTRIKDIEENIHESNRHILPQKEVENLLPETVVRESVSILVKSSTLKNKENILDKVKDILYAEYSLPNIKFGEYLDKKLQIIQNGNEAGYFRDKSGTIKQKIKFCDTAIEIINSKKVEWHIPDAAMLPIEKICKFITRHNT